MIKFLQLCNHRTICMRYIPTKGNIRKTRYISWEMPMLEQAEDLTEALTRML